jgi:hypothetical protein
VGAQPQQVIQDAGDLVEHHPDVLRPLSGTSTPSSFSMAITYACSLHIMDT